MYQRKILNILLTCILFAGACRLILTGSIIRSCIYTEEDIQIPEWFTRGQIKFIKSAFIGEGTDEKSCLPFLGGINRFIIPSSSARYFPKLKLIEITSDSEIVLRPVKFMSITKHGISTIDSGPGPIVYVVLKDQKNNYYKIPYVYFGMNQNEYFLKFELNGESQILKAETMKNIKTLQFTPDKKVQAAPRSIEQAQEL